MTPSALAGLTAQELFDEAGTLLVYRMNGTAIEPFICLSAQGAVIGYSGHVDLGQGIRTALSQIVAEELDIAVASVEMVLGDTARAPDQGATIASDTIQNTAVPLRQAAAQARTALLDRAAAWLGVAVGVLRVEDGLIGVEGGNRRVGYGELLEGERIRLVLDDRQAVKPASDYRIVGQRQPRVDIPAKATGGLVFVHDVRIDGMLHGRVVRPPYAGVDHGPFVGTSLIAVDEASVRHLPGFVAVVAIGDFVGVVAEREEQAIAAMDALRVEWKPVPRLPELDDLAGALLANPSTARRLEDKGDVAAALAGAATRLARRYVWPYQLHGSIGPSCAVADVMPGGARVWAGTQNPHPLRADIARLLDLPEGAVDLVRMEAAGCYGRNCADDVAADAALLSRAVGRPVRVQLTREQEHVWEPKGTAQLIEVDGGLDAAGDAIAYDYQSRYPSNGAPTLALLLTGKVPPVPQVLEMGDRTSIPPYDYANRRVTIHDMPPIVRASWLRGVSALPNSFAHESWIDEAAAAAQVDPVEYRLRYLHDPRARDLVERTAAEAGWVPRTSWGSEGGDGDILRGRGFAYALYVHSKFPGYGAAWSAWVADVEVNRATGEVAVTKITNGHDAGLMINPAGVQHQIHGNVIQSISRATREEVRFDRGMPAVREWGGYPLIKFPDVPPIETLMIERPDQPPLGAGESASVPSAAAIANAIYDACGIRFREPPFTPEKVKAALAREGMLASPTPQMPVPLPALGQPVPPSRSHRSWKAWLLGAGAALAGAMVAALPWRPAIAPIARPDPSVYSAATIERGRQLAALGDCAVCHTGPDGVVNAGGHAMATPFGTVVTTNITPDVETGIGAWSYPAFERAMRQGISRDGHHLYPAFPYTHFTRVADADMQALYAYLMAQEPVHSTPPATKLPFPFNLRPLVAGWNALFLRSGELQPDPERSADWNRGRYLVEGLGHCSACHAPRNALGAEKSGQDAILAGGWAEGWEAPALNGLSKAPVPWSEQDLFDYLRTGYSPLHGPAGGPMAPVVAELAALPDQDIRAMATYLASHGPADVAESDRTAAVQAIEASAASASTEISRAGRLYDGACAVCHDGGERPDLFGIRPSLAFNSNVHSDHPDNLIRVILNGAASPTLAHAGAMPAFGPVLDDSQIADLAAYIRGRFAPGRQPWENTADTVRRLRADPAAH
ncbi:nicotinate dehydrogenase subunit B [Inquilinus ginsengisoli]|uniref:Nicotinate dehydrogenase subunit B n=1 Tax=Inquilinus ginsengisoli TaxID=363840 RepID=A0ABU1JY79_9PROT|nr:molybdopterin cofactor-binding domain-containing protein [Inquilinus ginsengisoli]MDR6293232.1 nicotinate dehydrogenase subunit B [Inquilinus ginsengisoli]